MSAFLRCSLLIVLGILTGCSDEQSSARSGFDAESAIAQGKCFLGLTSGGVEYAGFACSGAQTSSSASGLGPDSWDDIDMTVSLALNTPPALGKLDVESLQVSIPGGPDGKLWDAPLNACTLTATKSFLKEDFGWMYYRIDVSCSAPALPATDNPGKPLDLGDFSLVTFFTIPR